MSFLVTNKLGKKLQKSRDKSLLQKLDIAVNKIEEIFSNNLEYKTNRVTKVFQDVFVYRIDRHLMLIFTSHKLNNDSLNITALDIVKHDDINKALKTYYHYEN
ncbi:MAG: hypothetical protein JKX79_12400 [Labilibaculum sp.]|nr:hypothetical protein [Labilibaculum sp.]